ncbi:MAG: FAD-binding protein [Sphingomonas bacterium]|uniref:FAD-binding protein n=1 Tax=Sphingomonas bacterium TaxID=1895847 RepID=UPI002635DB7B|nr:FAD-binding protein [Sphingomonas bacterium]MDB5703284.1 FAD-binding protein [Sphingomonas bacterium]
MPLPEDAFLKKVAQTEWTNFHGTVTVPIRALWKIRNSSTASTMAGMRETADRLQALIRHAVAQRVRLRAVGSRWSFSEVAAAKDGWALQTDQLNFDFTVGPGSVDPGFTGAPGDLVFAQAGASVAELNRKIEAAPRLRSFRTTGASNGQTLGGALGTGIHGSAIDAAGFEGEVAGLQLLTGTRNLWLEHPDHPTMNAGFAAKLGAELIRDVDLFSAALVSLGALGIVHSAVLRTVPRYRLRSFLRKMPLAQILPALATLDFTGAPLPDPAHRPYFARLVFDPGAKEESGYVTSRYKEACPSDYVTDGALKSGYEAGNDLPGVFSKILQTVPQLRPLVVALAIASELSPFENKLGTPAETYSYTASKPGSAGAAVAFPTAHLVQALTEARAAFKVSPYAPIAFACRFVQPSPALLGFTRFAPTCVMDVDGIDTPATRALMEAVRARFDAAGIVYAQHWGKLHGLTAARLQRSHGDRLARWHHARETLLPDADTRYVFSTDLLTAIGLHR